MQRALESASHGGRRSMMMKTPNVLLLGGIIMVLKIIIVDNNALITSLSSLSTQRSSTLATTAESASFNPPIIIPPSSPSMHHATTLPTCEELMRRPGSPYADGSFLTRRTTSVSWKLRIDNSRELTLPDTCALKRYTAPQVESCLRSKHLMFIGDSLTRYQYLSLAYFLEHGRWPQRFNRIADPCPYKNEAGLDACSTPNEPNVCAEGDWPGGWPAYQQSLGGGVDGGVFRGRLESHSTRSCKNEGENMQYVTAPQESSTPKAVTGLAPNNRMRWADRTKLSYTTESGWGEESNTSPGWNFTGCAYDGSCRYTTEEYTENIRRCEEGDVHFKYSSIEEAFGGVTGGDGSVLANTTTIFQDQFADVDIAFYNRGLWGKITDNRAKQMMKLLHDFTNHPSSFSQDVDNNGDALSKSRCFFRTTSGCSRSLDDGHMEHEYNVARKAAYSVGCEYMDNGHLTQEFALLLFAHPQPPRNVMAEYLTVFWDAVHYQPWVYEELNNLMLNVLCNAV